MSFRACYTKTKLLLNSKEDSSEICANIAGALFEAEKDKEIALLNLKGEYAIEKVKHDFDTRCKDAYFKAELSNLTIR